MNKKRENLIFILLLIASLYFFTKTTQTNIEATEVRGRAIHLEGGPPIYVVDAGTSARSALKGAHFNIHPDVEGWHRDRSLQIVSDLASHGYESILLYIEPGDYDHPTLGEIISLSTGLGMEVIVRFHVHFHDNLSGGGWDTTAAAMEYLYSQYGVEIFQPLNEVNACQDWNLSEVIPGDIPFMRDSTPDDCESGSAMLNPRLDIISIIFPGLGGGRDLNGYQAMGQYAAEEILNLLNTIYHIEVSSGSYKTPNYKIIVPPIIVDGAICDLDDAKDYYDGFVRYFMENRLSAWEEAVGGDEALGDVLPPILTPMVTIHMYSAMGLGDLCNGPRTEPLMNNVEDVVIKSTELRMHIQSAFEEAEDRRGRSVGYDMQYFVMTEAGPSPDVFIDACGGYSDKESAKKFRDIAIAWMDIYDLYCKDFTTNDGGGCIPYNFFSATMQSILASQVAPVYPSECPPGVEICASEWEITAIYPSALCSSDRVMPEECFLP